MEKTIRELGGEIWAELSRLPESELHWKSRDHVVEIVMAVLARYSGAVIKNDEDLPVSPLVQS